MPSRRFPTGTIHHLVEQISDSETLVADAASSIWLNSDSDGRPERSQPKLATAGQHVESVNDEVTPILGGKSSSYASCSEIRTRKCLKAPLDRPASFVPLEFAGSQVLVRSFLTLKP